MVSLVQFISAFSASSFSVVQYRTYSGKPTINGGVAVAVLRGLKCTRGPTCTHGQWSPGQNKKSKKIKRGNGQRPKIDCERDRQRHDIEALKQVGG